MKSFVFVFEIFCLGIEILSRILIINIEPPNNPVSKGKRGSFMSIFKTARPKRPLNKKTIKAFFIFFSEEIKKKETKIKRPGINIFKKL